jgi:tape measure domain-containing protein
VLNSDALLRIKASVSGVETVAGLGRELNKTAEAAARSVQPFERLQLTLRNTGSVVAGIGLDRLGQTLQQWGATALAAGERGFLLERRIKALAGAQGETQRLTQFSTAAAQRYGLSQLDAADAVANLYGRLRPMNVSLTDIEKTFNAVNNVSRLAGLTMYDTKEAFRQLGQAMGSGRLQGDEFRSIMERMPQIGVAIAQAFNKIAQSKGLKQISRENANAMIEEVKIGEARQIEIIKDSARRKITEMENGEKRQTDAIRREADQRIEVLQKESDRQIEEINRRYQRQEQLLSDYFQDIEDQERRSASDQLDSQLKTIDERYEAQRLSIEREMDARRDAIQQDQSLSDDARRQYMYQLQDQNRNILNQLRDQQDAENNVLRDAYDQRMKERGRQLRDEQQQRRQALDDAQREEVEKIQDGINQQKMVIDQQIEERMQILRTGMENEKQLIEKGATEQVETTKKASEAMKASINERVEVTVADLKRLASEGKLTTDILLKAMDELANVQVPPPTALDRFRASLGDLSKTIGDSLLPTLTPFVEGLTKLINLFPQLPEPVRAVAVGVGLLAGGLVALGIALAPLVFVLQGVVALFSTLAGLKLAATVAGYLGALQPFLAWIGSTFVPTLLAFFSGPAGWTVLAVAAVVTMVALFREPIWKFLTWLGEQFAKIPQTLAGMGEALKNTLLGVLTWLQENTAGFFQGFLEGMNTMLTAVGDALRAGITSAWDWIKKRAEDLQKFFTKIPENIGKAFKTAFDVALKAIRGAINTVIQMAGNAVNAFIQSVNTMIARINSMSARVGISLVYVPLVQIPQFAKGAYVTGPTLAMFGERRPEYAIPDDKMARASLNYLQGARGGAVLNSTPRTAASGGGSVSVSVKTGDVIQMPGMAEPMMLVSDGAAMVRAAVAQTLNLLNSSEGRIAGAF